jgi:hypothetical protein
MLIAPDGINGNIPCFMGCPFRRRHGIVTQEKVHPFFPLAKSG